MHRFVIDVDRLIKRYGSVTALAGFTIQVEVGQIYGLLSRIFFLDELTDGVDPVGRRKFRSGGLLLLQKSLVNQVQFSWTETAVTSTVFIVLMLGIAC